MKICLFIVITIISFTVFGFEVNAQKPTGIKLGDITISNSYKKYDYAARKRETHIINTKLGLDIYKLIKLCDSVLVINYYYSSYAFLHKKDSLAIIQAIPVYKKVNNSYKFICKIDTAFSGLLKESFITLDAFNVLYNLANHDSIGFINSTDSCTIYAEDGIYANSFSVESLSKTGRLLYHECMNDKARLYSISGETLFNLMKRFFSRYHYWEKLQDLIVKNGLGTYCYHPQRADITEFKYAGSKGFFYHKKYYKNIFRIAF